MMLLFMPRQPRLIFPIPQNSAGETLTAASIEQKLPVVGLLKTFGRIFVITVCSSIFWKNEMISMNDANLHLS